MTLKYATFEAYPCIYDDAEAWVLFDPGWTEMPILEVEHSAGMKTKEQFDKLFPHLPPLPKAAFQAGESA